MRFVWSLLGLVVPTVIYADVFNTEVFEDIFSFECLLAQIEVDLLHDSPIATQFCESLLAPVTTTISTTCVLTY